MRQKVTKEMEVAWANWNPVIIPDFRTSQFMRMAFMAGFLAARRRKRVNAS